MRVCVCVYSWLYRGGVRVKVTQYVQVFMSMHLPSKGKPPPQLAGS